MHGVAYFGKLCAIVNFGALPHSLSNQEMGNKTDRQDAQMFPYASFIFFLCCVSVPCFSM